jgi:hypothetical protein
MRAGLEMNLATPSREGFDRLAKAGRPLLPPLLLLRVTRRAAQQPSLAPASHSHRLPSSLSLSAMSTTFRAHCEAYIQTKVALDPVHLHPDFKFVGSLPDGAYPIDNRERYMAYREEGLRVSWPDWINAPTLVVCASRCSQQLQLPRRIMFES